MDLGHPTEENNTILTNRNDTGVNTYQDVVFYCYYYGIFVVIALVNLCGNSLILVSARRRNLRTPENYFIFSLATSDLIHGLGYICYNVSHMEIPAVRDHMTSEYHYHANDCLSVCVLYMCVYVCLSV